MSMVNSYIINRTSKNILQKNRLFFVNQILESPTYKISHYFDKDEYISCLINDLKQMDGQYIVSQVSLINLILRIVSFCIVLAIYNWIILVLAIFVLIIVFIVSYHSSMKTQALSDEKMQASEDYLVKYKNHADGFYDYSYANKKNLLIKNLMNCNEIFEEKDLKFQKKIIKVSSINSIIKSVGFILIILASVLLSEFSIIEIGTLLATFEFISLLTSDVGALSQCYQNIINSKPLIKKYLGLIKDEHYDNSYEEYILNNSISFENVDICIEDKRICKDINLKFEIGKKYAITGESGSGKSTILNTLFGFHKNYNGIIKIDGIELKDFIKKNILKVTFIDQNDFIFEDTILNNILLGRTIPTEKFNSIIKCLGIHEIIEEMPDGINQVLKNNGENISGGQRQKILLARALINPTNLFIFDESFSEIDEHNLASIEKMFLLMPNTTFICITHKPINYDYFDCIYNIN